MKLPWAIFVYANEFAAEKASKPELWHPEIQVVFVFLLWLSDYHFKELEWLVVCWAEDSCVMNWLASSWMWKTNNFELFEIASIIVVEGKLLRLKELWHLSLFDLVVPMILGLSEVGLPLISNFKFVECNSFFTNLRKLIDWHTSILIIFFNHFFLCSLLISSLVSLLMTKWRVNEDTSVFCLLFKLYVRYIPDRSGFLCQSNLPSLSFEHFLLTTMPHWLHLQFLEEIFIAVDASL